MSPRQTQEVIVMSKAVDVARYILDQREARGHMTTTFALQKLLYYCQSWMLVANDRPLFSDAIEAWQHGPVVTSVQPYCKGRHYIFPREIPDAAPDNLSVEERLLVDRVITQYEFVNDSELGDRLEEMSHEEVPWSDAVASEDKSISMDSMKNYYSLVQSDESVDHASEVPRIADVSRRTFISDDDAEWLEQLLA